MSEQMDLSFTEAVNRRDEGIAHAVGRALRQNTLWMDVCVSRLEEFVRARPGDSFLAEEYMEWLRHASPDLLDGIDLRAFGGVIREAAKQGLIVRIGYAPANTSNRSPKCLWRGCRAAVVGLAMPRKGPQSESPPAQQRQQA